MTLESVRHLAICLVRQGDYDTAYPMLQELRQIAVLLAEAGGSKTDVAGIDKWRGLMDFDRGHLELAEKYMKNAHDILEVQLGPDHAWTALARSHLAAILAVRGSMSAESAEKVIRDAADLLRLEEHAQYTNDIYLVLSDLYQKLGQSDREWAALQEWLPQSHATPSQSSLIRQRMTDRMLQIAGTRASCRESLPHFDSLSGVRRNAKQQVALESRLLRCEGPV